MSEGYEVTDDPIPDPPEARTEAPRVSTRRPARGRQSTGPRRASKSQKRAPTTAVPGPAETVRGLLQIPATAVVMVGQRAGSVPLVADGATVLIHGPAFADAVEEWAKADPRVAVILEKLVMFGPASAVAMALVIMGAQFYRNHDEGSAPLTGGLGAVPAVEIITRAGLDVPVDVSSNGQRTDGTQGTESA